MNTAAGVSRHHLFETIDKPALVIAKSYRPICKTFPCCYVQNAMLKIGWPLHLVVGRF